MYEVIEAVWPRMPSKDRKRLERMLGIWGDRSLFPSSFIRSLKRITEKSVPESPPGSPPASVVNSAKRDSRSTSHSEDEIAKRVLAHPVVQALMELEKNRMDKQAEQAVKGAFDTATKNMVQESALGMLENQMIISTELVGGWAGGQRMTLCLGRLARRVFDGE